MTTVKRGKIIFGIINVIYLHNVESSNASPEESGTNQQHPFHHTPKNSSEETPNDTSQHNTSG